jgi:hypothetical protein
MSSFQRESARSLLLFAIMMTSSFYTFFSFLVLCMVTVRSVVPETVVTGTYQLDTRFSGAAFFNNFDFFTVSRHLLRLILAKISTTIHSPKLLRYGINDRLTLSQGRRPNPRLCKVFLPPPIPHPPSPPFLTHLVMLTQRSPQTGASRVSNQTVQSTLESTTKMF